MEQCLSFSCGIPEPDNTALYMLGGGTSYRAVTRYTPEGDSTQLPLLSTARAGLACSGYTKAHLVLLAVGGFDGEKSYSSKF